MSRNLANLYKRLAKLEQECAEIELHEKLRNCNCPEVKSAAPFFFAFGPEQFEADMNQTCPVHGFRRLGKILPIVFVEPTDKTLVEDSVRLSQLINDYQLRLVKHSQSNAEPGQNDLQES